MSKKFRTLAAWFFMCALLCHALPADAGQQLGIESLIPKGQVQKLSKVVVRFDRPMAPLGAGQVSVQKAPMRLHPRPAGSFRWLDPQTLAYIFERPLVGASRLEVVIPLGARSLDGAVLAKERRTVITTLPIAALEWSPRPGKDLGPRPAVKITLNQAVALDSLTKRAWFVAAEKRIPAKVVEKPVPNWNRDVPRLAKIYILSCPQEMPPGAKVRVLIEPGVMPAQGDLPLGRSISQGYFSYHNLALVKWSMSRSLLGGLDPSSELLLQFNNPVTPQEALKHLKMEPPLKLPGKLAASYPSRWVSLPLPFKPRSQYKLTLLAGLKDKYNTTLAQGRSWRIATGDRDPVMTLPPGKGVLESSLGAVIPVRLRNIKRMRVGVRWMAPEQVVPFIIAEQDRPWSKKPKPPSKGQANTTVRTLEPGLPPNLLKTTPLDLAKLLGRNPKGGLVLVDLRSTWPDNKGKQKLRIRRSMLQTSDLGLSLKLGLSSGTAWVSRLSSGAPLSGVALELRDRKNRVLWKGTSNDQGLAKLPALGQLKPAVNKAQSWRNPQVFLLARHKDDFAVLPGSWGDSLRFSLPYTIDYRGPSQAPALAAHALFQLPLYQPGQTVRFVCYLRKHGAKGMTVPPEQKLEAWIEDPYGRKMHQRKASSGAYGSFEGSFQLTPKARLGTYGLVVKAGGKRIWAGTFRVASFRPPDFKVSLASPGSLLAGETSSARADIQARYLFGAPVAHGKAKVIFSQARAHFAPQLLKDYAVGDIPLPGKRPFLTKELSTKELDLSAQGEAKLSLPEVKPLPGDPLSLNLEARVSDPAAMAVTNTRSILVHPAAFYLGLKAPVMATASQPVKLELLAASHDNHPTAPGKVNLRAYRQYWETVRERSPGGFYRYLGVARRKLVWEGSLDLGSAATGFSFIPPESGTYVVLAEAKDQAGRTARSGVYLWAAGQGLSGWQRYDDHRLDLVCDKTSASPGQSVKLMIKNPFAKATALITVERLGVSRTLVKEVQGPAPVIDLPIKESDAPGVYLGVLLVRGRAAVKQSRGPDLGRPQVRIGYVGLKVKTPGQGLEVAVTPLAAKLRPNEKATVRVALSKDGQPVDGEVTLLAVDERILSAAGDVNSYDPRKTFARMPPLAVLSADLRTQVLGRFQEDAKGGSGEPGGGGGISPAMRRKFHPAVYWLARKLTGPSGKLEASFTLPGTLTAYRVVAVASDSQGVFGLGRAGLVASLPLQMLPALPRFATKGDKFQARVLVQNLGKEPGLIKVQVKSTGLVLSGASEAELNLEPGQMKPVAFMVEAQETGPASLEFIARMGQHSDAARFSLDVLPASVLITSAASGVIKASPDASRQIPLKMPSEADPGRGGLYLSLANTLASSLNRPVSMLVSYPWDCLEQRLSRCSARAVRLAFGKELGLPPEPDDKTKIQALSGLMWDYQTPGGGFAFWPGMGNPDAFLTAYALLASKRMGPGGSIMPLEMRKKALRYLQNRLRRGKPPAKGDLPARLTEAISIWALASHGVKSGQALSSAMTRSKGLTPFGLACLIQSAGLMKKDALIKKLVQELETNAEVNAASLHFGAIDPGGLKAVMGSSLRGNALALEALTRYMPAYPRLDALARWVSQELASRDNLSTQGAVFGLWGLSSYLSLTKQSGPLQASLALEGRSLGEHSFEKPLSNLWTLQVPARDLTPGATQTLTIKAQGEGRLFWASRLAHASRQPDPKPINAGLSVARYFQALDGPSGKDWKLGQELEYVLNIVNPATRHHVLVEAPYPAGLEPKGATSGRPSGQNNGLSPWRWQELRKTGLVLYAPRLNPGVFTYRFKMRAIAPGSFVLPPARAEEMYSPEVFGASPAEQMVIK